MSKNVLRVKVTNETVENIFKTPDIAQRYQEVWEHIEKENLDKKIKKCYNVDINEEIHCQFQSSIKEGLLTIALSLAIQNMEMSLYKAVKAAITEENVSSIYTKIIKDFVQDSEL